jgi:hypothetical protein
MPAPLPNILIKEPEEAISDVTVTDILNTVGKNKINLSGLLADFDYGRMNLHHLA